MTQGQLKAWPTALLLDAVQPLFADSPVDGTLDGEPEPQSRWPTLVATQYTFVDQRQSALTPPTREKTSLYPGGDREGSHPLGIYGGGAPIGWLQLYLDTEKKEFYIARSYLRLMLPLSSELVLVALSQDQIPGTGGGDAPGTEGRPPGRRR